MSLGVGRVRALVAGSVVLCWSALSAPAAHAFCRTTSCSSSDACPAKCSTCERDSDTGCSLEGTPIAWPAACLSFSMTRAASAQVDLDTATSLMAEAFATWEGARCGSEGLPPSIHVSDAFGPAECAEHMYNQRAGNANLVLFRDDAWPYAGTSNELAVTFVRFDDDGVIYDADIEINATLPLAVNTSSLEQKGTIVNQHDLLSIMVHEAGHFLGLDHSLDGESIMQAALPAAVERTQLGADDIAAICEAYPPERSVAECDPTPHGGFASACKPVPQSSGCSLGLLGTRSASGSHEVAALSVLALWLTRRRRRR